MSSFDPMATALRVTAFVCIALALLSSAALLSYQLDEPFGGYLAFNEGWYALVAKNVEEGGQWLAPRPESSHADPLPPLLAWLVGLVFSVLGQSEQHARAVCVAAALVSQLLTARLGWRLGGGRTAVVSVWILATMPLWVIVSRNLQTEAVYLMLCLAGFDLAWAQRPAGFKRLLLAGLCLGLAYLAKPFALVLCSAVLVGVVWRRRSLRGLRPAHVGLLLGLALPPVAYHGLQLLLLGEQAFDAGVSASRRALSLPDWATIDVLVREGGFGLGLPVCLLLVVALALAIRRRGPAERLLLAVLACFALFYLFVHYHSYYPYMIAPAIALLIGLQAGHSWGFTWMALLLSLFNGAGALATLGSVKLGRSELRKMAHWARERGEQPPTFFLDQQAYGAAWTVLAWYSGGEVLSAASATLDESGCYQLPYERGLFVLPPVTSPVGESWSVPIYSRHPVLFGWLVEVNTQSPHLFTWESLRLKRVGSINYFDWLRTEPDGVRHIERLPVEARACRGQDGALLLVLPPPPAATPGGDVAPPRPTNPAPSPPEPAADAEPEAAARPAPDATP